MAAAPKRLHVRGSLCQSDFQAFAGSRRPSGHTPDQFSTIDRFAALGIPEWLQVALLTDRVVRANAGALWERPLISRLKAAGAWLAKLPRGRGLVRQSPRHPISQ